MKIHAVQPDQGSLTPSTSSSSLNSINDGKAVVIVTPYSTGCLVARDIAKLGYKIICLWNDGFSEEMKKHVPLSCQGLEYFAQVDEASTLQGTMNAVQEAAHDLQIVAVVCGGEAGVDLADALSEHMGLRSNGTSIRNRRDKKVQHELLRAAGLRACRQAAGSELFEVEDFLRTERYPLIVKPVDSAGSDGVKLCHSYEEASSHFLYLSQEHAMVNGGTCEEVLCQEFLKGKEYVVDQVSLDGHHKVMMLWCYDKRPVNGAAFVYFGDIPVDSQSPEAQVLIPYAQQVLDVLGIKSGPTHGEFIITEDGPCLVEMNCRAHGGDGVWVPLCRGLTGGYCQVDATVWCYLEQEKFHRLPDNIPSPFKTCGGIYDLVSFSEGTVRSTPGYDRIKRLPSYAFLETCIHPGSKVERTVDLATQAGSCMLMHWDPQVVERDVGIIRALEKSNALFEYEELPPSNLLERKFSIPRDSRPVDIYRHDAIQPSMYLERKLSTPKDPNDMFIDK